MNELSEIAKAKVNLTLDVYGQRFDGYHELSSLVAFADIGDSVSYRPDVQGGLIVEGEFAAGLNEENLVLDVVAAVKNKLPGATIGQFVLKKNLPVGSGLGGGSADAAASIRLLNKAHPDLLSQDDWRDIAQKIGADVPVCLLQKAAAISGIGEKISILPVFEPVNAILVNPLVHLSTRDVFEDLSANPFDSEMAEHRYKISKYRVTAQQGIHSLEVLAEFMSEHPNQLEDAAVRHVPEIRRIKSIIADDTNCVITAMSGSGPTVFGLYRCEESAIIAADRLIGINGHWWIKRVKLS